MLAALSFVIIHVMPLSKHQKSEWRVYTSVSSAGNNVTAEQLDVMLESGQTDVFTQNVSTCCVAIRGGWYTGVIVITGVMLRHNMDFAIPSSP